MSGFSLIGTVLLIPALLLLDRSLLMWAIVGTICLLDTGGLLWLLIAMALHSSGFHTPGK